MDFLKHFCVISIFHVMIRAELLMVLEVFRHGARQTSYLLDVWWNSYEYRFPGELTGVGMRQHYTLGKILRSIYIDDLKFLSEEYDSDEMYIRSTTFNRTIDSATSQLYGLYPLGTGPKIPKDLDPILENPPFLTSFLENTHHEYAFDDGFQPFPIHTVPDREDRLLKPHNQPCPINDYWDYSLNESAYIKDLYIRFNSTFYALGRLINLTEDQIKTKLELYHIYEIFDVFICDIYSGKSLPKNISSELWNNLTLVYNVICVYSLSGITEQLKFYSTYFFQEIIDDFESKLNGTNKLKWKMFSTHDSTFFFLLPALNLTSYQCIDERMTTGKTNSTNCVTAVDFAQNLLIELYKEQNEEFIKIKYNGNYMYLCEKNEKKCSWDEFKQRLQNFMVDDYDYICNQTQI